MTEMLDRTAVSGLRTASVSLRPTRAARVVDVADYAAAEAVVEHCCQVWGGAADVLVPSEFVPRDDGGPGPAGVVVPGGYVELLARGDVDVVVGTNSPVGGTGVPIAPGGIRDVPLMLVFASREPDRIKHVEVCGPPVDDEWRLSYVATLGTWPTTPDRGILAAAGANEALSFEDVVRSSRTSPVVPGVADMLARLNDQTRISPAWATLMALTIHPLRTEQRSSDGYLGDQSGVVARQRGPDVMVVYTPGDVSDLCLLWNLRALHGFPRGVPLGVPVVRDRAGGVDVRLTAARLAGSRESAGGWFSFGPLVVSASLSNDAVEAVVAAVNAQAAKPGRGLPDMEAASPDDVLVPGQAPGRDRKEVVVFDGGRATVATRADTDRDYLRVAAAMPLLTAGWARLSVVVDGEPVVRTKATRMSANGRAYAGRGPVLDGGRDELAPFRIPFRWTQLELACRDKGLLPKESPAGRSASALVSAVGGLHEVLWLTHPPLLELLQRAAAGSAMGWYKERTKRLQSETDAALAGLGADAAGTLESISRSWETLAAGPGDDDDQRAVNYGDVCRVLSGDKDLAREWIRWAEERALLVRGSDIQCPHCAAKFWRPLREAVPPFPCPGCGRSIMRPQDPQSLRFSYRVGEVLRRAFADDSVYHLFVLRHVADYLGPAAGIVGFHPGVDFYDTDGGHLGETDVLLLLDDATLVVGEVKKTAHALHQRDLDLLDGIATRLASPAVILGSGQGKDATIVVPTFDDADVPGRRAVRVVAAEQWRDAYPSQGFGSAAWPLSSTVPADDTTLTERFLEALRRRTSAEAQDPAIS